MGCGTSSGLSAPPAAPVPYLLRPLGDFLTTHPAIKSIVLVRHANAAPRDAATTAAEFGIDPATIAEHANAWTASDLNRVLTD